MRTAANWFIGIALIAVVAVGCWFGFWATLWWWFL